MTMSRSLSLGFFALVAATFSGGCGPITGAEVTATVGSTLPQTATAPAVLPPTRTSPPMSPPPTPTPGTPGLRAAPIPETVHLIIDTPVESLPPGEYLAVFDEATFGRDGTVAFDYLSWDGSNWGDLFHFESKPSLDELPSFPNAGGGWLWSEVKVPGGLYFVNLGNLDTRQFGYGEDCRGAMSPPLFGPRFFAFGCIDSDSSDVYLHAVSFADLRIEGTLQYPSGLSVVGWYGSGRLEFSAPWQAEKTSYRYCMVEPSDWSLACRDLPFHVGTTNATGEWTWVAPKSTDEEMPQTEFPIAVVPRSCVDQGLEGCEPKTIFPAAWKGQYETLQTCVSWSPDGRALVVSDVNEKPCAPTHVWAYDVVSGASRGVAEVEGCYQLSSQETIWSRDGRRFALSTISPTTHTTMTTVVSLDGTTYLLPTTGSVVASFVVP